MTTKEKIINNLHTLHVCCEEALDERWDKGDSGFVAMRDLIDDTLELIEEEDND